MTSLWSTAKSQVPQVLCGTSQSIRRADSLSSTLPLSPFLFPPLSPMTSPSFYPGCSSNVLLLVPLPGAWMSSAPFRNQVIGVISITQAWALVAMQAGPGPWWLLQLLGNCHDASLILLLPLPLSLGITSGSAASIFGLPRQPALLKVGTERPPKENLYWAHYCNITVGSLGESFSG